MSRRCGLIAHSPELCSRMLESGLKPSHARLLDLERAVVEAWPAEQTLNLGGWLLRSSGGPTRRGNSVSALDDAGSNISERIAAVERWYAERSARTVFQIGPCTAPPDLDAVLESRGYLAEGDSRVATASPSDPRFQTGVTLKTEVLARASDAWLQLSARESRYAESEDVLLDFLSRIDGLALFATAYAASGLPAAVGLGIRTGPRLGVYAMFTSLRERRQGAARRVLGALAERARNDDVRELYLLVDAGNLPARSLYASCGFEDAYAYHYRVRPASTAMPH